MPAPRRTRRTTPTTCQRAYVDIEPTRVCGMSMTTNSNTADDAIFDNDSDVTDVDTGAVGVAAVKTPTAPVPDCACARCGRRSVRRAGARAGGGVALALRPPPGRDLLRTAPPSTISTGIEFCKLSFAETRKPVPGAGARAGAAARGHQRSTGRADHDQHQPGSGRLRIGVRSALTRYQGRRRRDCRPVCPCLASPARFQAPRQRNLCYRGDAEVGGCAGLLRGRPPAG